MPNVGPGAILHPQTPQQFQRPGESPTLESLGGFLAEGLRLPVSVLKVDQFLSCRNLENCMNCLRLIYQRTKKLSFIVQFKFMDLVSSLHPGLSFNPDTKSLHLLCIQHSGLVPVLPANLQPTMAWSCPYTLLSPWSTFLL